MPRIHGRRAHRQTATEQFSLKILDKWQEMMREIPIGKGAQAGHDGQIEEEGQQEEQERHRPPWFEPGWNTPVRAHQGGLCRSGFHLFVHFCIGLIV